MNILDLVRQDVGEGAVRQVGGEYCCPCPSCGGNDRFHVFPDQGDGGTWMCRGCPPRDGQRFAGGDAIQYLRDFRGMTFSEACKTLGKSTKDYQNKGIRARRTAQNAFRFKPGMTSGEKWRVLAEQVVEYAHEKLLKNQEALAYLAARGVSLKSVRKFRLGWLNEWYRVPKRLKHPRSAWGLQPKYNDDGTEKANWLPAGIVIPCYDNGTLIRLRVRQKDGYKFGDKYYIVPGSVVQPMVTNPDATVFVPIEAELDAIAIDEACEGLPVSAIGLGSLGLKPTVELDAKLQKALKILNALDYEPARDDASEEDKKKAAMHARMRDWWQKQYGQCVRYPVPQGKDPGEAYALGVNLRLWVKVGLPPVCLVEKKQVSEVCICEQTDIVVPKHEPCEKSEKDYNRKSPQVPFEVKHLHSMLQGLPIWIDAKSGYGVRVNHAALHTVLKRRPELPRAHALIRKIARSVFSEPVVGWVERYHRGAIVEADTLLAVYDVYDGEKLVRHCREAV